MIRMDKFLISQRPYAVKQGSLLRVGDQKMGSRPYNWCRVDAVWRF